MVVVVVEGGSTKFNVKHQGKVYHQPPSTIHKWPFSDLPRSTLCPSLSLSFTIWLLRNNKSWVLDLVITRSGQPWARSSSEQSEHWITRTSGEQRGEGLGAEILGKIIGPERCLRWDDKDRTPTPLTVLFNHRNVWMGRYKTTVLNCAKLAIRNYPFIPCLNENLSNDRFLVS